jgi:hypothetical protein
MQRVELRFELIADLDNPTHPGDSMAHRSYDVKSIIPAGHAPGAV